MDRLGILLLLLVVWLVSRMKQNLKLQQQRNRAKGASGSGSKAGPAVEGIKGFDQSSAVNTREMQQMPVMPKTDFYSHYAQHWDEGLTIESTQQTKKDRSDALFGLDSGQSAGTVSGSGLTAVQAEPSRVYPASFVQGSPLIQMVVAQTVLGRPRGSRLWRPSGSDLVH